MRNPKNSRINAKGAVSKSTTKSAKSSRGRSATNEDTVEQQERLLQEAKVKSRRRRASSQNTPHKSTSKTATRLSQVASEHSTTLKASPKKVATDVGATEKRLRRFRSKPPASFDVKLLRARTQRMIVLGRRRSTTRSGAPAEDIDVVGSTGNVYTVHIGHETSCTCPDSIKGNECKHKVYALNTVLKAPAVLVYQLAFLSPELKQIFAKAPPIPTDNAGSSEEDDNQSGNRKPTEGECPICYMDLDPGHNKLVWCKSQCGHNLHKSCFDQWAASQRGQEVRCVYCRSPWQAESGDLKATKKTGKIGHDGYVNVADQFGMSRARDYSGYHQPWVRRQFGVGW
ncbi:uncharacterized protein A1O9_11914 [Exophiala aquamarina CBS 119918]|uniref:Uncharacterized protein n=1 Tax=Exophiala aquamarina CBS 119918 TaxID=1182545 RepID=A0A072P8M9_9EURO|nr:uncharacterized protein A1O9_11914 [Exophiala aquamarina CBS 119918]KEF51925.1 hypothetical protein A1O9_11914 [Exophiala aquamarina CBS 119918]